MITESPVRIAIVGAGLIGRRHIQHIIAEPRCQLAAIVEPSLEAKAIAERAGAVYFSDIETFLKKGDAGSNYCDAERYPCLSRISRGGFHLFVEKPIDSDLKAASMLVEAAHKAGVKLLIGHHRRFNAYIEATKHILEEGDWEQSRLLMSCVDCSKAAQLFSEVAWRREPGGGPVFINLIHDIDNLRYLFGDIERIYAESSNGMRGYSVEETAVITINSQRRIRHGARFGCRDVAV